jgi:signal transduction histidine kinase
MRPVATIAASVKVCNLARHRPENGKLSSVNDDARTRTFELDTLASVARVARVLVGIRGLPELGDDAMAEIREALHLEVAALYLADGTGSRVLRCLGKQVAPDSRVSVTETVSLDSEAWRFVTMSGGPLVFREATSTILENPFEPPADHWLVVPLVSQLRVLGAVVGCSPEPISLAPAPVTRLTVIGDLLSAGAANALLRAEVQRTELQRERMRLAEEIHDSLAQDLAVAVRELALLETRPPQEVARASEERLREAVIEAHRIVRRHLDVLASDIPSTGLRDSVESVSEKFRLRGLAVTLAGPVLDVADAATVVVVTRVLNEALANVQRHAGVGEATVSLIVEHGSLHMSVMDKGCGFDADAGEPGSGHFGLAIMRNRVQAAGGTIVVRSRPRQGTSVELSLPMRPSFA